MLALARAVVGPYLLRANTSRVRLHRRSDNRLLLRPSRALKSDNYITF